VIRYTVQYSTVRTSHQGESGHDEQEHVYACSPASEISVLGAVTKNWPPYDPIGLTCRSAKIIKIEDVGDLLRLKESGLLEP